MNIHHTYITSYTGQIQAVVVVHFQPFVLIKILLANLKISIRCCLINLSNYEHIFQDLMV